MTQVVGASSLSRAARRPQTLSSSLFTDPRPLLAAVSRKVPRGRLRLRGKANFLKGLILAQNERWRRGLGMQVERIPGCLHSGGSGERGSKAWVTYPGDRDSLPNGGVIPGDFT